MLSLTELLHVARIVSDATDDRQISGISADSRTVAEGKLFVAIDGMQARGTDYVPQAIERGAVAIVASQHINVPAHVALIIVDNPRLALAKLAAVFYAKRPEHLVAVTGTNGKTSVADFYRQIMQRGGHDSASLGTLGLKSMHDMLNASFPGGLTSADPVVLCQTLDALATHGVSAVALEASSHGLDQHRLDGLVFESSIFTNLTQDHLDYHADMAHYFAAKKRLFLSLPCEHAIIHADDVYGQQLLDDCAAQHIAHSSYGHAGKTIRFISEMPNADGIAIRWQWRSEEISLQLPLYGAFQVQNIAAAAIAAMHSGLSKQAILAALQQLQGVRGRMEKVGQTQSAAALFVDYAHTPDALEKALLALRAHCSGKLLVVFGCGGNRDATKRPLMGAIAAKLADSVIITDDNPRHEDPAFIRAQIRTKAPKALEISDRREAIYAAVQQLQAGDILLVAGKGHETSQIIGNKIIEMNDAEIIREAIAA